MNPVLETQFAHRSIRRFAADPLDENTLETLVRAAQMAPTSSYKQAYSIIGVHSIENRALLARIAGQPYVAEAPHAFLFLADLFRHQSLCEKTGVDAEIALQSTEEYTVAVIDAALAAQNLALAAESLDLGTCFIGALRNDCGALIERFQLPPKTFPLFAVIVGKKAQKGGQRPRLPLNVIYHQERYQSDAESLSASIADYDQTVQRYYATRPGAKQADWSSAMVRQFSPAIRLDVHQWLQKQGFLGQ